MDNGIKEISVSILEDYTDDKKIMDDYICYPDNRKRSGHMTESITLRNLSAKSNTSFISKIKNIFKSSKQQ